jgi:hypothetical protein
MASDLSQRVLEELKKPLARVLSRDETSLGKSAFVINSCSCQARFHAEQ